MTRWQQKAELRAEQWLPLILAAISAGAWRAAGGAAACLILAKNDVLYQTVVMFATIVVALLATYKAIILTAENSPGIALLKTNGGMFTRFVNYIFWSICANMVFAGFAFFYLIRDQKIEADWVGTVFVFFAAYSILSLLRILILFRIVIGKRAEEC